MTKSMRHLTLTLSLILGLTTAANANAKYFAVGDVFFCQMEEFVAWEWKDAKALAKRMYES